MIHRVLFHHFNLIFSLGDFENMGYRGEIDDSFSEELMIEPDISLDYDDIEDTSDGTDGEARTFIQNSLMCSFCSSHFDNQEQLLDHLRVSDLAVIQ